jgi:hypothetical protein
MNVAVSKTITPAHIPIKKKSRKVIGVIGRLFFVYWVTICFNLVNASTKERNKAPIKMYLM